MGVLSQILGSSDVLSKGLDLIDSLHTSETEAIEAKTKAKTELLSAYAPFKIAQRYLALIFSFTFVASYFIVLAMYFLGDKPSHIEDISNIIVSFKINWIMLTIVAFYFGGGAVEGVMRKKTPD